MKLPGDLMGDVLMSPLFYDKYVYCPGAGTGNHRRPFSCWPYCLCILSLIQQITIEL